MIITWMNFISLFALALAGSGVVFAGRRIGKTIKEVEVRIAKAVDEKNAVAADLRRARREGDQIKVAIDEAEQHLAVLNRRAKELEDAMAQLRAQPRLIVGLVDNAWQRQDRLWRVSVQNPSLASAVASLPGDTRKSRLICGYARTGDQFLGRVLQRYSPASGFLVGAVEPLDLASPIFGAEEAPAETMRGPGRPAMAMRS